MTLPRAALAWLLLPAAALGKVYHVGPLPSNITPDANNIHHGEIHHVPWGSVRAGDEVRIYWRRTPYRSKWQLTAANNGVVIRGIGGLPPVIEARYATQAETGAPWYEEGRAILIIGDVRQTVLVQDVLVENLEFRGARPERDLTTPATLETPWTCENGGRRCYFAGGVLKPYAPAATGIYVGWGKRITIRNCKFTDNNHGLFVSSQLETNTNPQEYVSEDIVIEGSYFDNNALKDQAHSMYLNARRCTVEGNYFYQQTPTDANHIKDRCAGSVIRYNYFDGGNYAVDLVQAQNTNLVTDATYHPYAFVYGNVFVKRPTAQDAAIHLGSDSGDPARGRKVAWIYNNAFLAINKGPYWIILQSGSQSAHLANNYFYASRGFPQVLTSANGSGAQVAWSNNRFFMPEGGSFFGVGSNVTLSPALPRDACAAGSNTCFTSESALNVSGLTSSGLDPIPYLTPQAGSVLLGGSGAPGDVAGHSFETVRASFCAAGPNFCPEVRPAKKPAKIPFGIGRGGRADAAGTGAMDIGPANAAVAGTPAIQSFTTDPNPAQAGVGTTGRVTLSGPAPPGGLVVFFGNGSGSGLPPPFAVVPSGQTDVTFPISVPEFEDRLSLLQASTENSGAALVLNHTRSSSPKLFHAGVVADYFRTNTVYQASLALNGAASPVAPFTINLTSSRPEVAAVNATVLVQPNVSTATFPVTTGSVTGTTVISVTFGQSVIEFPVTVVTGVITQLALDPVSTVGGSRVRATVTIDPAAPAGGAKVSIGSSRGDLVQVERSDALVRFDGTVTVPAGQTTQSFYLDTCSAYRTDTATIRAFHEAYHVVKDANLTIAQGGCVNFIAAASVATGAALPVEARLVRDYSAPVTVTLTSSNPAVLQVPSTLTFGQNSSRALFDAVAGAASSTQIVTVTATGSYVGTSSFNVTVVPQSGSALSITAPSAGQTIATSNVSFSWTAVSGTASYDLRVTEPASARVLFTGQLTGESANSTVIGLPAGQLRFEVRACVASGSCGGYVARDFTVQLASASAPAITFPTAGSTLTTSTHTLSWTAVSGAVSYEVTLQNLSKNTTDLVINVAAPATSTVFSMRSGAYRMSVRACIATCGDASNVLFSVQLPAVPTGAPVLNSSGVTNASGQNRLTLAWSAVARADLYVVRVIQAGAGPGGAALTVASTRVSATTAELIVPNGTATVLVQACNGDGCGPQSAGATISPGFGNPTVPLLGEPVGTVDGPSVTFSWSRVPGDTGSNTVYRLFVQDFSRQRPALDILTHGNFYAAQLAAGRRYDALVVANPDGAAVAGPAQGFTVWGASPSAPTLVSPQHGGRVRQGNVSLGWTPSGSLYQYFVARTGQAAASATGVSAGIEVQVPLAAVGGADTSYSGIVRVCNSGVICTAASDAGWGPWSNAAGGPGVTTFTVTP